MDKELFLKPSAAERLVDVPGKGQIRIRSITRGEARHMYVMKDTDPDAVDGWLLHKCLLDPVLTQDEATVWLEAAPLGEAADVLLPILELCGLVEESAKKTYAQFRGDGPGLRVPPGGAAGDDGGPPAGGDD